MPMFTSVFAVWKLNVLRVILLSIFSYFYGVFNTGNVYNYRY